jgi:uncharacterized membrane protein YecN with MAPEG domain
MTTPLLSVTPIYAATLALMLIPLAVKIIKLRWAHRVSLLDGGHSDLLRAIRAHGNFTEYVPLCLILLAFSELNGLPVWGLHLLGSILLAGRLFHAYGLQSQSLRPRQIGMYLTFASLIAGALSLLATLFLI